LLEAIGAGRSTQDDEVVGTGLDVGEGVTTIRADRLELQGRATGEADLQVGSVKAAYPNVALHAVRLGDDALLEGLCR